MARLLTRGALIHILQSRVYIGEIVHGEKVHPGLHEPIIERDMFDAVQAKMKSLARAHHERPVRAQPGALLGKLFDANGEPMGPTFAYGKQKQLYRYYMPVSWQTRRKGNRGDGVQGRISADALEAFLVSALQRFTGRTMIAIADLAVQLSRVELRSAETHIVLDREATFPRDHPDLVLAGVQRRIASDETAVLDRGEATIRIVLPHRLQLRGGRACVRGADQAGPRQISRSIVKALRRGHADLLALKASPLTPAEDLVEAAAPETAHERQIARLALMSPVLQRRIMEGDHPSGLALRQLLKCPMPLAWADQVNLLEDLGRSDVYRVTA